MTDADSFLQAILDNPDDDVPRLVFADWLDEHGDTDRAEFIRLQIERSSLPPRGDHWQAVCRRASELLGRHRDEWLAPVLQVLDSSRKEKTPWMRKLVRSLLPRRAAGLPHYQDYGFEFQRGFLTRVSLTSFGFVAHAEELFQRAPIQDLWIDAESPYDAVPLFECKQLSRVRELQLCRTLMYTLFEPLFKCPHLGSLNSLNLVGWLDLPHTEQLAAAPLLRQIRHLLVFTARYVEDNNWVPGVGGAFDDDAVQMLARSPNCAGLTSLVLSHNQIGNAGAQSLADSPHLAQLHVLDLAANQIGDTGAWALAGSRHLSQISLLSLEGNPISEQGRQLLRDRFGEQVCFGESV